MYSTSLGNGDVYSRTSPALEVTMWVLEKILLASLPFWTFAWLNRYQIVQEKITMEYLDHKYMDATIGVYPLNETTNGLNATFRLKIVLPDTVKFVLKGSRWLGGDYRLGLFQVEKTISSLMDMERFGLESLCVEYTRPPLVWPLEKGVTYRSVGWSPDSSKFPPNIPEGKWKTETSIEFANKTRIVKIIWFSNIVYH